MKSIIKRTFFVIKKFGLKFGNVTIEKNVSFLKTEFAHFNRVWCNTKIDYSVLGSYTYIGWDSTLVNVKIGSFCSIGPKVEVIRGTHPFNMVSTSPVFYSTRKQCGISFVLKDKFDEFKKIPESNFSVIIGNDVWIGFGAKLIEGITIGDGAIVLAGAYVTQDVEPFSIVGGIPARNVKYRFDSNTIMKLMEIKWWERDSEWLHKNADIFTDIELFLNKMQSTNNV